MKKINLFLFTTFMLSLALLPLESLFAVDVPLKSGQPGIGTFSVTRLGSSTSTTVSVTATLNDPQLVVDFSSPVGVATISILDATGSVVYQESIDTYSTPESVIDVSIFDSGNYTLKITYGRTTQKGTFRL